MRAFPMQVKFCGAAGEVTGSRHLVEFDGQRILLDCGLIQGGRNEHARNAAGFGFDPAALDVVVVSHAHLDHIGRLPLLVKRGYRGPIYMTRATAELARIMLEDAASLAAADVERENRGRQRRGEEPIAPLYLLRDVNDALHQVKTLEYGERRELLPGLTLRYEDAGHILGAAIVELVAEHRGQRRVLVFSGDIGPLNAPLMRDPTPLHEADLVLMESTYGDRCHRSREETVAEIGQILQRAASERGNVLIPAFAVGRSQEILYWLARHYDDWQLGEWQIVLDSPMAAKVTELYGRYQALFDEDAQQRFKGSGRHPFRLPNLRFVSDVQESMALNRRGGGCIIIAGSGMCNGGRIRHHLRHNLWRPNVDIIFAGFQAQGTLGRQLVDGAEYVNLFGERIRVRARRHTVGGLSAHADQNELLRWYGHFRGRPPLALVHGEDSARTALAERLKRELGAAVTLARPGRTMAL